MRFGEAIGALKAALRSSTAKAGPETAMVRFVTRDEQFGNAPNVNSQKLAQLYVDNPWARTIVSKIGQAVAKQPWFIETPNGERIDKHPALDFIRRGCKGCRGRKALKVTQVLLELQGECFWIVGRNAAGVPVEYAPIPSHWVLDTPNKTFNGFRIQPRSGVPFEVDASHVIHFHEANPVDPYARGTSVAQAAWADLETDKAAATFLGSYFVNHARPDLAVMGTESRPMNEKDLARAETSWLTNFRGTSKKGRPFFSASKLEIQEIGSGLRDNQMQELRDQLKENALQTWGVPPELFGKLSSSNRATIESAEFLFAKHTVEPRLLFLLEELEDFCVEEFDVAPGTLKFESPVSEDVAHALECVKVRSTAFTDNEVRALARMKPVAGKDEFPEAPDPNRLNPDEDKPGKNPKAKPENEPENKPKKTFDAGVRKALSVEDVVRVSNAHEDPQVRAEVTRMFDEIFTALVEKFGSELLEVLESEANFQVMGEAANFIIDEVPSLVGQIDKTTRKELAAALAEGAAASESVAELITRVEGVFSEAAKIRASTISDTVATKLAGFTTQTAAKQAGFDHKKWLSTRDHKVRDSHAALDRQVKLISEPFVAPDGSKAMHPGAFGKAAEDINCRCAMRPVIQGEKAAAMSDVDFERRYEELRVRVAKRFSKTLKDVFAGQQAVVITALKYATEWSFPHEF